MYIKILCGIWRILAGSCISSVLPTKRLVHLSPNLIYWVNCSKIQPICCFSEGAQILFSFLATGTSLWLFFPFHSHVTEPFPSMPRAWWQRGCIQPLGYTLTCANRHTLTGVTSKIEFTLIGCSSFDSRPTEPQHSCSCKSTAPHSLNNNNESAECQLPCWHLVEATSGSPSLLAF